MMLLTVPAGAQSVTLVHSWGYLPLVQLALWLLIGSYLLYVYIRRPRRV
jgi:hypothetical protein